jgi:hypothetical protein
VLVEVSTLTKGTLSQASPTMSSDSEDDLDFEEDASDQEQEIDDDILGALEESLATMDASEAEEVRFE